MRRLHLAFSLLYLIIVMSTLFSGVVFFEPSVFYHGKTNFSAHVSQNYGYAVVNIPLRFPFMPTDFLLSISGVDKKDRTLTKSIIFVESSMNAHAYSYLGAAGLMQLMPKTAEILGVSNRFNPFENVKGGYKYLKDLEKQFNNQDKAIAAYHFGPGNVSRYGIVGAGKTYLDKVRNTEEKIKEGQIKASMIYDTAWLSLRGGFKEEAAVFNVSFLAQPFGVLMFGINAGIDISKEQLGVLSLGVGLSLSERNSILGCMDLISRDAGVILWTELWNFPFQIGWDNGAVLTTRYKINGFTISGGFYGGVPVFELGSSYRDINVYAGWNETLYLRLEVGY